MKISNDEFPPLAAWTLKLVGVILILSFLLNFLTLLFPFKPLEQSWQITLTTQLVESGIIPMVGLALIFAGYALDRTDSSSPASRKAWFDLRFWALVFSSIFGLLFLVLFPLHLSNVSQASAQAVAQIDQKAAGEVANVQNQLSNPQVQAQLEQQQTQLKTQINTLLKNEQQYNQVLASNQFPQQLKDLLQQAKANPKGVDQLVQQRLNPEAIRTQALKKIQDTQTQAEEQAKQEALKSGLRIGSSNLLLAIGYIVLGWTGLRSLSSLWFSR